MGSVNDDVSRLGKPATKEEMDKMSYMHPVVMPHHPHSTHFTSLPSLDTSNISVSTSVSSSSGSEIESLFTTTNTTPTTGTADTSVAGSPTSPNCSGSYGHPQVIELHEVNSASIIHALDEQEQSEMDEHARAIHSEGIKAKAKPTKGKQSKPGKPQSDPASPPLLTCTFRPKELLRKRKAHVPVTEGGVQELKRKTVWEFVPTRVPDGISLRNFGIQVVSNNFSSPGFCRLTKHHSRYMLPFPTSSSTHPRVLHPTLSH